ncbi:MAG: hypothetical protein ACUVR2_10960 [Anaerolineae bacterium]
MSKAERVQTFHNFLHDEGYVPSLDEEGDIRFKCEGRTYLVILDERDEEFFQLAFPNFWPIESEEERAKVENAALTATAQTKVAKVFPVRDNVWATIELFCSSIDHAKTVFHRSLGALQSAVVTFADEMRK